MATASINFAEDLGPSPKIVHVSSKSEIATSHSNLFYDGVITGKGGGSGCGSGGGSGSGGSGSGGKEQLTDRLTHALLSHRQDSHGAWTFREDTERDLLAHVENGLSISNHDDKSEVDTAAAILRSIDVYCLGKQWMFHVGAEKGEVIQPFLHRCLEAKRNAAASSTSNQPFVAVELGAYCGYSAVLLAMTARRVAPDLKFHLYSTEMNAGYLEVASKIIKLAKMEQYVTLIQFDPCGGLTLAEVLGRTVPGDSSSEAAAVDFLFLDHAKDSYLSDLREMEGAGLIGKGSYVAADNVIASKAELSEYRRYVASLAERGVAETSVVEGKLEYTQNLKDGIEFTVYLQDPPTGKR